MREVITTRQRDQVRIIFDFRNIVLFPFNVADGREITLTGTGEERFQNTPSLICILPSSLNTNRTTDDFSERKGMMMRPIRM